MNASMIVRGSDALSPHPKYKDFPRKQAEIIKRAGERMNELIEDLLSLAKIEAGHMGLNVQEWKVTSLIQETLDMLQPIAKEKSIRIQVEVSNPELTLIFDYPKILRVLSNLLGNALKFTHEEGSIKVSIQDLGKEVLFTIEDTGPGIAEHHIPFIFDRFWQVKSHAARGTGLGLSIAKGIVELHGGKITVESSFGEGSRFSFVLQKNGPKRGQDTQAA